MKLDPQTLIYEAEKVAAQLIQRIRSADTPSASWMPLSTSLLGQQADQFDLGLATGASGVPLFLAELYAITSKEHYLEAAQQLTATIWEILPKQRSFHFGCWSGKGGMLSLLLRLYEITGSNDFLDKAVELISNCQPFLDSRYVESGLLDGLAGFAAQVVRLHHYTQKEEVLNLLEEVVRQLLLPLYMTTKGICWQVDYHRIRPLCGIGDGVAGLVLVLQQAGRYLQTAIYDVLIRWGLNYNEENWNETTNNWPNYDKPIRTAKDDQKYAQHYRAGDAHVLYKPADDLSYRYGTLGMAIQFLLLQHKSEAENYTDELQRALRRVAVADWGTQSWKFTDLSALFFINQHAEKWRSMLPHDITTEWEKQISQFDLDTVSVSVEGIGLENGLSGLGYYYLVAAGAIDRPYFLCGLTWENLPFPKTVEYTHAVDQDFVITEVLSRNFARTLAVLRVFFEPDLPKVLDLVDAIEPYNGFRQRMDSLILQQSNHPQVELLKDVFHLEQQTLALFMENRSFAEVYVEHLLNYQTAESLLRQGEEKVLEVNCQLKASVHLVETRWSWQTNFKDGTPVFLKNYEVEPGEQCYLLRPDYAAPGYREVYLDRFDYLLVNFEEPISGQELLDGLLADTQIQSDDHVQQLKQQLVKLIITSLQAGYIEQVS